MVATGNVLLKIVASDKSITQSIKPRLHLLIY